MIFDVNEVLQKRVQKVVLAIRGFNRGDEIRHDQLGAFAGVVYEPDSQEYRTLICGVRKALLDARGIALVNLPNHGYRLATVREQASVLPMSRMLAALRDLRTGIREVNAIPEQELTENDALLARANVNAMSSSRKDLHKQVRKVRVVKHDVAEAEKKESRATRNAERKAAREKSVKRRFRQATAAQA